MAFNLVDAFTGQEVEKATEKLLGLGVKSEEAVKRKNRKAELPVLLSGCFVLVNTCRLNLLGV